MAADLQDVYDVIDSTVANNAEEVDETGRFPRASIDALADAGALGLLSAADVDGMGRPLRDAAEIVSGIAEQCGSTAMVMSMHYCGAAVLEQYGGEQVRRAIASGRHLTTLAFSESGSRGHFWSPESTAAYIGDEVVLNGAKSWVTSGNHADSFIWSSHPVEANDHMSTLWLVEKGTSGIEAAAGFDGIGLRGNDSVSFKAAGARITRDNMLGSDGGGFQIMLQVILPFFNVLNAAVSLGIMEAATNKTAAHASGVTLSHLSQSLNELPTIRAYIARMRVKTDMVRGLVRDTLTALENDRGDQMLRVLECKAAAGEEAVQVLDLAMRVCGGAAFGKEVDIDRHFRDSRATGIMAPTTDVLYDFIGKAVTGLELF